MRRRGLVFCVLCPRSAVFSRFVFVHVRALGRGLRNAGDFDPGARSGPASIAHGRDGEVFYSQWDQEFNESSASGECSLPSTVLWPNVRRTTVKGGKLELEVEHLPFF